MCESTECTMVDCVHIAPPLLLLMQHDVRGTAAYNGKHTNIHALPMGRRLGITSCGGGLRGSGDNGLSDRLPFYGLFPIPIP